MARSAGLGRAPDALGLRLRALGFTTLMVWAALRSGAVLLADLLTLTLALVALSLWQVASSVRASPSASRGRSGLGLPLAAIVAGLPLALGVGPGIRGALEWILLWAAFAWGLAAMHEGRQAAGVWGLRILVLLGVAQAVLGVAQVLLGEMPAGPSSTLPGDVPQLGVASGTLRNPNHYATLLALTLAPALGLLRCARTSSTWDRRLAVLGLVLWPLALAASRSRGAALALVVGGLLVWLGVRGWRGRHRLRGAWGGWALATLGGIVAIGAVLRPRFELWGLERRLLLYGDVIRWIGDAPWWGHGLGLFRWRFRPHQRFELPDRYDHAHNEVLEVAAEVGVPAALLLVLVLGWWWWRAAGRVRSDEDRGLALGALLAASIVAVHGLLDFGTRMPVNLLLLGALLGAVVGAHPPAKEDEESRGPWRARLRIALWVLALGVLAIGMVEAVRTRVALAITSPPRSADEVGGPEVEIRRLERALGWAPELPSLHLRLGLLRRDEPAVRSPGLARDHLERAAELNPWSWRYPRELGRLYDDLGQFDRAYAAHTRALARDPRAPLGHWRLVELGLRHDRPRLARAWLRSAVAGDPRLIPEAVPRWLALGGTVEALVEAWPRALRGELLGSLAEEVVGTDPSEPHLDTLAFLFDTWIGGLHRPDPSLGSNYLEILLDSGLETRARQTWHRLLAAGLDLDPAALTGDRLWNGGFEQPLIGGPLGWNIPRRPGQRGDRVAGAGPDGSTALRITLDRRPSESDGRSPRRPRQAVVVEPGELLIFEGVLAVEGNLAGARLQLFDPESRRVLAEGPTALPGEGWTQGKIRVQVGEGRLLRVRLAFGGPEGTDPKAESTSTVWLDGLALRPEGAP